MTPRARPSAAFTLTEIMVTSAIIGLILIGVLPFFLANSKSLFVSEQKLLVNGDLRAFTNGLIQDVESASGFMLYQSFYSRTLSDGTAVNRDINGDGVIDVADRMQSGQSGDFLVLVYYQDPFYDSRFYDDDPDNQPTLGSSTTISRIVAYWLAPNRNYLGETALYRFDTDQFKGIASTWMTPWGATFPATLGSGVTVESLLPPAVESAATDAHYAAVALNNLQGLSSNLNFVNYQGRSVFVRSRILHGNQAKRVTNIYNFTVSPRG